MTDSMKIYTQRDLKQRIPAGLMSLSRLALLMRSDVNAMARRLEQLKIEPALTIDGRAYYDSECIESLHNNTTEIR